MRIKRTGRKEIGDHPSLNLTTRTKRVQACKTKQMHRIPTQDCKAQGARNMCTPTPTQHQVFIKNVNGLTPLLLCITGAAVTCHPWRACNRTRRQRREQRCSKWWFNVLHCGVECKQSQYVAQRSSATLVASTCYPAHAVNLLQQYRESVQKTHYNKAGMTP